MSARLDHTIVAARDRDASARFLAEVLGLEVEPPTGHFSPVRLGNGVTLDFADAGEGEVASQHYAFVVSDARFDAGLALLRERGIPYWADPGHHVPETVATRRGGRAIYFPDPSGHNMEIMTSAG